MHSLYAYVHCRERDNRSNDYSKLAVCFNDVVNPARFTAADALRSTSIRPPEKRYLTSQLTALTQSNFINPVLSADFIHVPRLKGLSESKVS